jgi:NAD(P)-dependent dehydrogenase (short-subunit alcohol dehydrogenase family)
VAERVALVTGGGSGIGAATARALAASGVAVMVADIDAERAAAVAAEVSAAGGEAASVVVDVRDAESVRAMVAATVERFGALHVAVNSAGVSEDVADFAELPWAQWERTIDVNLSGTFRSLQAEIPAILAAGGGAVVNVSSVAGLIGFPGNPSYVASKHGVVGLTKTAALEYARRGIRVNAVCPGTVDTPMLAAFTGDEATKKAMGRLSPMGRLAEPDEIAAMIVFLCSEAASYVTGQAVAVDAGATAT